MEATMELSKTPNMSDPLDISNHPDIHYLSMYRTTHYSFSLEVFATQPLNPIKLLNVVRLLATDSTQFSKRLSFFIPVNRFQ
jgi:hypothetical protein